MSKLRRRSPTAVINAVKHKEKAFESIRRKRFIAEMDRDNEEHYRKMEEIQLEIKKQIKDSEENSITKRVSHNVPNVPILTFLLCLCSLALIIGVIYNAP
jgi:hypothetical protein